MYRTDITWIQAIVCALVLGVPSFAGAADVTVSTSIGYAQNATARTAIRDQCQLQTVIPAAIADSSPAAELVEGGGNLTIEITNAHGPGGWVFSGPKWLEVKGKLRRGGQTYNFRAKRYSAFDPFGGVCSILQKCGRAIGSDIATWLENPTNNAEIGDAR